MAGVANTNHRPKLIPPLSGNRLEVFIVKFIIMIIVQFIFIIIIMHGNYYNTVHIILYWSISTALHVLVT